MLPYYDGMRALRGAQGPLRDVHAPQALNIVHAMLIESLSSGFVEDAAERLDELEGWMTCSFEQALQFVGAQQEQERDDRMAAARMMGAI